MRLDVDDTLNELIEPRLQKEIKEASLEKLVLRNV